MKLIIREKKQIKKKIKFYLSNYPIPRKIFIGIVNLLSNFCSPIIRSSILKNFEIKRALRLNSVIKILIVTKTLGPGGAERQLLNLANKLVAKGRFKVTVVCFNCNNYPDNFYLKKFRSDIKIINLELLHLASDSKIPTIFRYIWSSTNKLNYKKLLSIINDIEPDVVHGWLDEPALIASLAGLDAKVPKIIISARNMNPSNFLANRVFYRGTYMALTHFSNIVFLNNSIAGSEDYEKWLGLEKNTFKTIYNGYDISSFNKFKKQIKSNVNLKVKHIGTVCRLDVEKDIELWLNVLKKLIYKPDLNFTIIGDGPKLIKIKNFVMSNNLKNRVEILSPSDDVYSKIVNFDIFLLTSKFEGLPNVLIEAQLLGVPVVTTNVGGCSETFRNYSSGVLVEKRDANTICGEILGLLGDKHRYNSFVKNSKIHSRQLFDIDKIVETYISQYRK